MEVPDILKEVDKWHVYLSIAVFILILIVIFLLWKLFSTPTETKVTYSAPRNEDLTLGTSYARPTLPFNYSQPVYKEHIVEDIVPPPSHVRPTHKKYKTVVEWDPKRSKFEAKCGEAIEKVFGVKFPKVKPSWLVNPNTGRQLELDFYNEELGIALEAQGMQHYDERAFNQGKETLDKIVERDEIKYNLCVKNNVYLIRVPYTVPFSDIEEYIEYYKPENRKMRLDNGLTN